MTGGVTTATLEEEEGWQGDNRGSTVCGQAVRREEL